MPSMYEIAHVTIAGKEKADVLADSVEARAWLLWSAAVNHVLMRDPLVFPMANRSGSAVAGWRYEGSMSRFVRDLWPETQQLSDDQQRAFTQPIYRYLASTSNAVCVVKTKNPVWWLRATYNEVGGTVRPERPETKAEKQEAKVTAQEAGEDRAAGPVTTTKRAVSGAAKMRMEGTETPEMREKIAAAARERGAQRKEESRARILDALIDINRPVTLAQLDRVYGVERTTAKKYMAELAEAGLIVDLGGPGGGGGRWWAAAGAEGNMPTKALEDRPYPVPKGRRSPKNNSRSMKDPVSKGLRRSRVGPVTPDGSKVVVVQRPVVDVPDTPALEQALEAPVEMVGPQEWDDVSDVPPVMALPGFTPPDAGLLRQLVDDNASLKAENARLRKALDALL